MLQFAHRALHETECDTSPPFSVAPHLKQKVKPEISLKKVILPALINTCHLYVHTALHSSGCARGSVCMSSCSALGPGAHRRIGGHTQGFRDAQTGHTQVQSCAQHSPDAALGQRPGRDALKQCGAPGWEQSPC